MKTILKSEKKIVTIQPAGPFVIIGEKINPTGSKKLSASLQSGDFSYLHDLAVNQVEAGADVLDVNVGVPGIDDVSLMKQVIARLCKWVEVPLCLDSPNLAALAAGLEMAPGKPLVNSVSGETSRLQTVLPLVKDRGAAVIGLIMNDDGIPATPEARLAVAEKILEQAARLGIPQENVIIDPLVMAVGADTQAGLVTLKTIQLVKEKLDANINLGASNVSHGLPDRPTVNMTFLSIAITAGATCAITDPIKMGMTIRAVDLLLGRDEDALRYLKGYRKVQALLKKLEKTEPASV